MAVTIAVVLACHVVAFGALLLLSRLSAWPVDDAGRPRPQTGAWAEKAVPASRRSGAVTGELPRDAAP